MSREWKARALKARRFALYALRWQCSTPIYAVILHFLRDMNTVESTVIANAVGACVFYWIDRFIFSDRKRKRTGNEGKA